MKKSGRRNHHISTARLLLKRRKKHHWKGRCTESWAIRTGLLEKPRRSLVICSLGGAGRYMGLEHAFNLARDYQAP